MANQVAGGERAQDGCEIALADNLLKMRVGPVRRDKWNDSSSFGELFYSYHGQAVFLAAHDICHILRENLSLAVLCL